jgi:S-adenosylmethionine synthetase
MAAAQVILHDGVGLPDVKPAVEQIIEEDLKGIQDFSERLARGELSVW